MIRDYVKKYYIDQNRNCAESLLLAANEALGLELQETDVRLIAGFGGGIGCGDLCGAVAGSVAVLGRALLKGPARDTPDFGKRCAALKQALETKLCAIHCKELKPKNFTQEARCLETVLQAADVLDEALAS